MKSFGLAILGGLTLKVVEDGDSHKLYAGKKWVSVKPE